jgi:hypothetical protein
MLNKTSPWYDGGEQGFFPTDDDDIVIPIVAAVPLPADYHDGSFPSASASESTPTTGRERIVFVENGDLAEDEEWDCAPPPPPPDVRVMSQQPLPVPACEPGSTEECCSHGTTEGSAESNHPSPCSSHGDGHYNDTACGAAAGATAPRPMNRGERRELKRDLKREFRSMKKEAKQSWKDMKRAAKEEWKAEKSALKSSARDLKQSLKNIESATKEEALLWKAEIQREKQLLEDNTRTMKEGAIRLIREGKQELSEFKEAIRSIAKLF